MLLGFDYVPNPVGYKTHAIRHDPNAVHARPMHEVDLHNPHVITEETHRAYL